MNVPVVAVALSLLVIAGGGYLATQTLDVDDSFNFLDSGISCEYQVVDIDGQTFSSKSEFKSAVEANGGNWTSIESKAVFRTRGGTLEYKLNEKTCQQYQQVNNE